MTSQVKEMGKQVLCSHTLTLLFLRQCVSLCTCVQVSFSTYCYTSVFYSILCVRSLICASCNFHQVAQSLSWSRVCVCVSSDRIIVVRCLVHRVWKNRGRRRKKREKEKEKKRRKVRDTVEERESISSGRVLVSVLTRLVAVGCLVSREYQQA